MDKGFKIVLGRIGSEEVLMHLLNRLLGTKIVHLEYRNTEHPGMTEEERSSRFDVYCEDVTPLSFCRFRRQRLSASSKRSPA